jgi:hypothetical protein
VVVGLVRSLTVRPLVSAVGLTAVPLAVLACVGIGGRMADRVARTAVNPRFSARPLIDVVEGDTVR